MRLPFLHRPLFPPTVRLFSLLSPLRAKPLPPLPQILEGDITETFLRGTGPGGQKINKTSCAVQLQHHPTGIVVKCQESRSRTVNRAVARKWLAERIEERELGDGSRLRQRQEREAVKKRSAGKKKRRKYRALAEGKGGEEGAGEGEEEGVQKEDGEGRTEEGQVEVEERAVSENTIAKDDRSKPP
ncbi:hypothetical protein ANO11243_016400 [Dothideomycetidae sp. 11243]|nr:hypothetical protein ANO11243_016400 [fungal sp. No.11243]